MDVREAARAEGFDLVGVCAAQTPPHWNSLHEWVEAGRHGPMAYMAERLEMRGDPSSLLPGARSIVMTGLFYDPPVPHRPGYPRVAAYALGRDYHKVFRGKLRRLAATMQQACPGESFRVCVDSAPLMERDFAQLAGLGWFGKNTCLINSQRGSYFLLGALLTTLAIEPNAPAVGGCGTCRKCVDACPTGAIVFADDRWQVDARRCISTLTIEQRGPLPDPALIGEWTFGCDVCQEVCPFNAPRVSQPLRAPGASDPDLNARREWPPLRELALINEEAWDELTRGSAVRRAGWEGLRRNARGNLENGGVRSVGED